MKNYKKLGTTKECNIRVVLSFDTLQPASKTPILQKKLYHGENKDLRWTIKEIQLPTCSN